MEITFVPKLKGLEQFEIVYNTQFGVISVKEYRIDNPNKIFKIKIFQEVDKLCLKK